MNVGAPRSGQQVVETHLDVGSAIALAEQVIMVRKPDPRPLRGEMIAEVTSRHEAGFTYRTLSPAGYGRALGNKGEVTARAAGPGQTTVTFWESRRLQLFGLVFFGVALAVFIYLAVAPPEPNAGRAERAIRGYWFILVPLAGAMVALALFNLQSRAASQARLFREWAQNGAAAPPAAASAPMEQLQQLHRQHQAGLLTAAQYEQAKLALLAKIA